MNIAEAVKVSGTIALLVFMYVIIFAIEAGRRSL